MEFTLPIFLKLFPNMLPSTFQGLIFLTFVNFLFYFINLKKKNRAIERTRKAKEATKSQTRDGQVFTRHFGRNGTQSR